MGARTTDHWNNQVAWSHTLDVRSNIHDLSQGLMSDDQAIRPPRRHSILKRTDLPVGPADPHLSNMQHHLSRTESVRLSLLNQPDFPFRGKHRQRLHRTPPTTGYGTALWL